MALKLKSETTEVVVVFVLFAALATLVFFGLAEGSFTGTLTLSAMAQCLAFVLLLVQVNRSKSVAGISARGLGLDAMALCCRLSNTLWLNGYLPYDASGDYAYQLTDIFSLCIVAWLLYQVLVAKRHTYDEQEDTFPARHIAIGSLILSAFLHGDLNDRPIFDALWMTSVFVGALAAIPQLSLIARAGGLTQSLTTHHIAALALSRVLSGAFMWEQGDALSCEEWITGVNHAMIAVLGIHAVHLLLLADFGYFYVTSVMRNGLNASIQLEGAYIV